MKILTKIENDVTPKTVQQMIEKELQKYNDKAVSIEIKEDNPDKIRQYGYLFGTVYPIAQAFIFIDTGERLSLEDTDTLMKLRFWYEEVPDVITGELHKIPNRKRDMNKREMEVFIENILGFIHDNFSAKVPERSDAAKFSIIKL
jgi:hypothetical protein